MSARRLRVLFVINQVVSYGGAERFDDSMIERMHVEAARRLLSRAASADR